MKIGEALQEKKRLQARLAKCQELSKQCYEYTTDKPDFDFNKLQKEIDSLTKSIKQLKMSLQKTNLKIDVTFANDTISLQELIIDIADIRSKLNYLNTLYNPNDRYHSLRYEEKESKRQVPPEDIQEMIKNLTKTKNDLDSLLQHTNWTEELIE